MINLPCSPSPGLGGQGGTEGPGPQPQPRMTLAASLRKLSGGLIAKSCPTLADPWTVVCQAPLSMGFPRQESWSGLPFPSPGDLPDPGIKPGSPALQTDSLPTVAQRGSDTTQDCRSTLTGLGDFTSGLLPRHRRVPQRTWS